VTVGNYLDRNADSLQLIPSLVDALIDIAQGSGREDTLARYLADPHVVACLKTQAMSTPDEHLDGYMMRYWLVTPAQAREQGLPCHGIRLHHILREDRDRHMHNHPWGFRSYILSGHYYEESRAPNGTLQRTKVCAGDTYARGPQDYHRITQISAEPLWTLCVLDAKNPNGWGFLTDEGHVDSHAYLNY